MEAIMIPLTATHAAREILELASLGAFLAMIALVARALGA